MTSNSIQNSIIADRYAKLGKGSSSNRLTNKYYDRVKIESLLANLELVGKTGPAGPSGPPGADGVDALLEPPTVASGGTLSGTAAPGWLPVNQAAPTPQPMFFTTPGGLNTSTYLPGPGEGCRWVLPAKTAQYTQFIMLETKVELPSGGTQIVYIPAYF